MSGHLHGADLPKQCLGSFLGRGPKVQQPQAQGLSSRQLTIILQPQATLKSECTCYELITNACKVSSVTAVY